MFKKFLNLNFNLLKFGTGEGINRYKHIIFFVIFLFSINIKSFGELGVTEPNYNDNQYEISSKEELNWFAQMINEENEITNPLGRTTDAKLTQDIEVIESSSTEYGYLQQLLEGKEITADQKTALENLKWTPIGKDNNKPYTGTFDGNGKTISGLYFNDTSKDYVGLFGYVKDDGVIKNIGVKNSYFKANNYVGGLIGYFYVSGTGEVTSSYSSGCTVEGTGSSAYVGGLIGRFYVAGGGTGAVTSSYSSGCTVEGGSGAKVGGLIGYFYVASDGTGEVTSSYSSGCTVTGAGSSAYVGGLIGWFEVYGKGEVTSSYSSGCTVEGGSGAKVGGLIGGFRVNSDGTGAVTKCFYSTTQASQGTGNKDDGADKNDVTGVTDVEFKGESKFSSGIHVGQTVLEALNAGVSEEDLKFKQDSGDYGTNYPVHVWSERVAYVTGFGVYREYVHPVDSYKLSQKIKIDEKEYSGGWIDSSGVAKEFVNTSSGSVTVFGAEKLLKIPVRVKINYDPSNKLETWVREHVSHEFSRKTSGSDWDVMSEGTDYFYVIDTVPNSIKIGVDGSKTQDFVFNYYIVEAKDDNNNNNKYQFGFNKKYKNVKDDSSNYGMSDGNAFMTYIKQDVGGGKKLFIDYDIDPKQILENYENYSS